MGCIQELPCELLLQIMISCDSDILSFVGAYPTALRCFSKNRICFATRMFSRLGDVALPSFVMAARLRYMRQEPRFQSLGNHEVQKLIEPLLGPVIKEPQLPSLHKFSLAALCMMLELGEDAKQICDAYSQQALATMVTRPGAKFHFTRQSTHLTQDERRRFMEAAFNFESYCLAFFRDRDLLFPSDTDFRKHFFHRNRWMSQISSQNIVGRFYCIRHHILKTYQTIVSIVAGHLESIHGRVRQRGCWLGRLDTKNFLSCLNDEEFFLDHFHIEHRVQDLIKYTHVLTSQGLGMLARLQRMSYSEQAQFVATTYRHFTMHERFYNLLCERLGWVYIHYVLHDRTILGYPDQSIWEDIWSCGVLFWDPSEEEEPYGTDLSDVREWRNFWFLR